MRFYMNILTTYFPDRDSPYDVYYQQILEQIQLAEELGWECFMFNEHHFLGYGGLVAPLQEPRHDVAVYAGKHESAHRALIVPQRASPEGEIRIAQSRRRRWRCL